MKKYIDARWIIRIGVVVILLIVWFVILYGEGREYEAVKYALENKWKEIEMIENQPEYLKLLAELSDYTIEEVKKKNGEYIVSVVVNAPNLGKRLEGINYENFPKDDDLIDVFLCECVKESILEEKRTEIYVTKIGAEYQVIFSDEFINTMSGNVYVYAQNKLVELFELYMQGGI